MNKIKCPVCNGSGLIKKPKTNADNMDLNIKAAKLLREQGFSIRAIMVLMHYKSPQSVSYLLNQ